MSYDVDMCKGVGTGMSSPCPLRTCCKRYVLGRKAMKECHYPIWWLEPVPFGKNKCKYFIEEK